MENNTTTTGTGTRREREAARKAAYEAAKVARLADPAVQAAMAAEAAANAAIAAAAEAAAKIAAAKDRELDAAVKVAAAELATRHEFIATVDAIEAETEKAFLLRIDRAGMCRSDVKVWVPRSQVEVQVAGGQILVGMPKWLAAEKKELRFA